jgi:hypothetical protein
MSRRTGDKARFNKNRKRRAAKRLLLKKVFGEKAPAAPAAK